jgi:hypothetical protein
MGGVEGVVGTGAGPTSGDPVWLRGWDAEGLGSGGAGTADLSISDLASKGSGSDRTQVVAGIDIHGDGSSDLLFGNHATGERCVHIVDGPALGTFPIDDVDARICVDGTEFGVGLEVLPDLDGDGYREVFVGAPYDGAGRAWLFSGSFLSTSTATVVLVGDDLEFGRSAGAADLDDDSALDLLVGAADEAGRAHVWYGPLSGTLDASSSDYTIKGVGSYGVGWAVETADGDADGLDDVFIGMTGYPGPDAAAGSVLFLPAMGQ